MNHVDQMGLSSGFSFSPTLVTCWVTISLCYAFVNTLFHLWYRLSTFVDSVHNPFTKGKQPIKDKSVSEGEEKGDRKIINVEVGQGRYTIGIKSLLLGKIAYDMDYKRP